MKSCKNCGKAWGESIFLWVDDALWKAMGCKPTDFLCANCIVDKLRGVTTAAYLVKGEGTHQIKSANATLRMKQKHRRVIATPHNPMRLIVLSPIRRWIGQ